MLGVGILHHQQLECFDGSEVTGKGNDSIAQKQNCVVEEIKEVKLRSRRGKFIYNRTYNSVGLNIKVSQFSRRGRAPSRLPMKKLKSLVTENTKSESFWQGIRVGYWAKYTMNCRIKFHCYVKNTNGLDLYRYRSKLL